MTTEPHTAPAGHLVNLAEAVVLKTGNVFAITRRDGSLPVAAEHPLGLYKDDCRFLSGHELFLGGTRPRLLVTAATTGSEVVHELTNSVLETPDGRVVPLQTIQVRLQRVLLEAGAVEEALTVVSFDRAPLALPLALRLAADFEPMLAIRGIVAGGRRREVRVASVPHGVRFALHGRDGVHRATTVTAEPSPSRAGDDGWLGFDLRLTPGRAHLVRLRYALHEAEAPPRAARRPPSGAPAGYGPADRPAGRTRITTDDALFDRVLRRALLDVQMLRSTLDGQAYYAAGIPWYATLFGRDSIITALEMLAFDPAIGEHTARLLGGMLGRVDDPAHDEEPGKVLHELRVGEVARLGLSPLARYYGTVDATPLLLCLLCEHADWSGDLRLFRALLGEVEAMLGWIDRTSSRDRTGLLEYTAQQPGGLRNQGWKDSDEGVLDEAGTPLEPPIALVEAQAYVLRAKRRLAELFALDGEPARARRLREEADQLAGRLERFWLPDRCCYSMALDGDRRPSRALASNQGHLLWALALPPERARAVRDALMGAAMFSGWGIRTLGAGERGYNPVGYHLGTVWPHDTALIAAGLRAYGHDEDFLRIFEALLDAAASADAYRLPELFAGYGRTEFETPVPYPVACRPQAWAAGAIPFLLTTGLGLRPDGLRGRLRIRRPSLPAWVGRVEVHDLCIADSRVDLVFERTGKDGAVALSDARIRGDVEVVLEITGSPGPDQV